MKRHGWDFALLAAALLLSVFSTGCSKNSTGPAGPAGTGGYVMQFQYKNYPSGTYTGVTDTGMDSLNSNTNYSDFTTYSIGYSSTDSEKDRYIIRYDLSSVVPGNINVTAAYLTINVDALNGSNSYLIYPLTAGFTQTTATWNDRAASTPWTTPGGDYSTVARSNAVTINALGKYTFTLDTAMVQGWVSNPAGNYGIIIVATNESSGDNIANLDYDANGTVSDRPLLTVYYKLP